MDQHLFEHIMRLMVLCQAFADEENKLFPFGDNPHDYLNPYWNRTISGLFLEMYYGLPDKIWTPAGHVKVGNGETGRWRGFEDYLRQFVDFSVYQAEVQEKIGYIGPVYAIHAIDGVACPEPFALDKPYPDNGDVLKAQWIAFLETVS